MIIFTTICNYNNIKLNETRIVVENIILEYEKKHGADHHIFVEVKCVAKFLDKIKTK